MTCSHDDGPEFTGHNFQEVLVKYNCLSMLTTIKNLQVNSVVERMHLTFENNARTKVFEIDTWDYVGAGHWQSCSVLCICIKSYCSFKQQARPE